MKILVDENIPRMTVSALREPGHDVRDVRGTRTEGMGDSDLWNVAVREQRLLITTDKGFTEHRHEPHHGILIVRLRQPNRHKIHNRVMQAYRAIGESGWAGLLIVMRDRAMSTSRFTDRI